MTTDAELSREVAQEAGRLLLALREGFGPIDDRDAANELRKRGDRESHLLIMERVPSAYGSSIRSTAPTSTARAAPTSRCTSRSGSQAFAS